MPFSLVGSTGDLLSRNLRSLMLATAFESQIIPELVAVRPSIAGFMQYKNGLIVALILSWIIHVEKWQSIMTPTGSSLAESTYISYWSVAFSDSAKPSVARISSWVINWSYMECPDLTGIRISISGHAFHKSRAVSGGHMRSDPP